MRLRLMIAPLFLLLAGASAPAAAPREWPSWLDWLLGRRERAPAAIERTSVSRITTAAGVAVITERYTVRSTPDGRGAIDSLAFAATATGQPAQDLGKGSPIFPTAIDVTWQEPPPGGTITTQACGRLRRRGLLGPQACSASRTYTTPDVAPPPIVIDTLEAALTIGAVGQADQEHWQLVGGRSVELCLVIGFRTGRAAGFVTDDPRCQAVVAQVHPGFRALNVTEQAWIDQKCFELSGDQPGRGFSQLPSCWQGAAAITRLERAWNVEAP